MRSIVTDAPCNPVLDKGRAVAKRVVGEVKSLGERVQAIEDSARLHPLQTPWYEVFGHNGKAAVVGASTSESSTSIPTWLVVSVGAAIGLAFGAVVFAAGLAARRS